MFSMEKNRKETMEMSVKAYGDAAMKRMALHKWYSRYEDGYKNVMYKQRSGQPTSFNNVAERKSKNSWIKTDVSWLEKYASG